MEHEVESAEDILEKGKGYQMWRKNWGKKDLKLDNETTSDKKAKTGVCNAKKVSETNIDSSDNGINEKDPNTNANVKEEVNTKRDVEERNVGETEKKMPIIDEEIKRKYKIEGHEQLFAYDTAVKYNDIRSIGNYLKLMKKLDLPMFQRVKAYVDEQEGVKNEGAYFNTMARLELSKHVISKPEENDKNKSKSDRKVDKKK